MISSPAWICFVTAPNFASPEWSMRASALVSWSEVLWPTPTPGCRLLAASAVRPLLPPLLGEAALGLCALGLLPTAAVAPPLLPLLGEAALGLCAAAANASPLLPWRGEAALGLCPSSSVLLPAVAAVAPRLAPLLGEAALGLCAPDNIPLSVAGIAPTLVPLVGEATLGCTPGNLLAEAAFGLAALGLCPSGSLLLPTTAANARPLVPFLGEAARGVCASVGLSAAPPLA
mmetsp:Transcript_51140/g.129064  ORF Transcript_51140/g.129064 Transcript_51140/m.129064 type:complete len:231 (-) Transcript_51140:1941-2633(-)